MLKELLSKNCNKYCPDTIVVKYRFYSVIFEKKVEFIALEKLMLHDGFLALRRRIELGYAIATELQLDCNSVAIANKP